MYRNIKYFSTTLLVVLFVFSFASAKDLQTDLTINNREPRVGDEITVNIRVIPDLGFPVYTVSETLNYNPEYLEFIDARLNDSWFSVVSPPFKVVDRENGLVTITGGYPEGTDLAANFANFTFRVKKSGNTSLFTTKGFSYDYASVKTQTQRKKIDLSIEEALDPVEESNKIITALEPTGLKIEGNDYSYRSEDYNFLTIHKKSEEEIATSTTNIIGVVNVVDSNNMVVYSKHLTINPRTDDTQSLLIPKNTLLKGDYKILFSVNLGKDADSGASVSKNLAVLEKSWFEQNFIFVNSVYILVILLLLYIIYKLTQIIHIKVMQRRKLLVKLHNKKNKK